MEIPKSNKHPVKVPIPHPLLKDLLYVHYLITTKDTSAIEETDDCIQTHNLCGGLWDKKKQLYGFTYYPNEDASKNFSWEFQLTRQQIKAVSEGKVQHLGLWKCESKECQNFHNSEESRCLFCVPIDSTLAPKYSDEELKEKHREKLDLLNKWRKTQ